MLQEKRSDLLDELPIDEEEIVLPLTPGSSPSADKAKSHKSVELTNLKDNRRQSVTRPRKTDAMILERLDNLTLQMEQLRAQTKAN